MSMHRVLRRPISFATPGLRIGATTLAALAALTLAFTPRVEAFVYWSNTDTDAIGRSNLDGTGVNEDFIPGANIPIGVAVDAAHVYWASIGDDAIGRANIDGSGANRSFVTAESNPAGVAVDAAHVYWTNVDDDTIGRANLDGTGVNQGFITAQSGSGRVAVDSAHVYWTNEGGGTIGRANLDGTGVNQSFVSGADAGLGALGGVAVDSAHVYWSNAFRGTIGRANLDGTGVDQTFIKPAAFPFPNAPSPDDVAVDRRHIYWTDVNSGTIGRANLDGTRVKRQFITDLNGPFGVAADALGFSFGKLKRNKRNGTAKLTVKVPGPGELDLVKTAKVRRADERAEAAGKTKLPIKPRGDTKERLQQSGKATVKANVTFTPDGGRPTTSVKRLKLIQRR